MAQSAGFKLAEIKELIEGIDSSGGMGEHTRALSATKLSEVEALLERTQVMQGWLEVAKECGCATPEKCALFETPDDAPVAAGLELRLVHVPGKDCRRPAVT